MAKYVLFGSTNETALHFIHQASKANLKILCLYPYDPRKLCIDRNALIISSLGGYPLRYNFRSVSAKTKALTYGPQGPTALEKILQDVNGVVWAADPDMKETTSSRDEERFEQYLEDLQSTFDAMKSVNVNRFLCLTHKAIHIKGDRRENSPRLWSMRHGATHSLHSTTADLLSSTMKQKLDWTIIRTRRDLDRFAVWEEGTWGIELGAKPLEGVWREDVARTMVEILKVGGPSRLVLDVKTAPLTNHNSIGKVIARTIEDKMAAHDAESVRITEPVGTQTVHGIPSSTPTITPSACSSSPHSLNPSLSTADPILSTLNPQNFPKQFAHLTQQNPTNTRMSQILEQVRYNRSINETASKLESKHNEELRRSRELARLEAQKKGLPPPGADIKMLRRASKQSGAMAKAALNNIYGAVDLSGRPTWQTLPRHSTMRSQALQARLHASQEMLGTPTQYNDGGKKDVTLDESGGNVFETLADALFDRSVASGLATTHGLDNDIDRWPQYAEWQQIGQSERKR